MALTKANAKQVAIARSQLATNPGFYARSIAAMQRCAANERQQAAVYDVIHADRTSHLFASSNGCLIAIEQVPA